MGHTACTEPQCLYKGELYLYYGSAFSITTSKGYEIRIRISVPAVNIYITKCNFNPYPANVENRVIS